MSQLEGMLGEILYPEWRLVRGVTKCCMKAEVVLAKAHREQRRLMLVLGAQTDHALANLVDWEST